MIKKYTQITLFLVFFAFLILLKNYIGHDDNAGAIGQPVLQSPVSLPTVEPVATKPAGSPLPTTNSSIYKDGTFTGSVEDAYYGNIQVQAIIQNGQITDVVFLQYPNDNRTSLSINSQATVYLKQEAIAVQSAKVNTISGASDSSFAFRKSMATALSKAHR